MLGGASAARRAPSLEIANALATGVVYYLFGFLFYLADPDAASAVPAWCSVATMVLTLPLAWLGGIVERESRASSPTVWQ